MTIAWFTVQNALQAWVSASTGIPSSRVIWSQQNGPRPAAPYITLRLNNIRRIGQDWLQAVDNPLVVADQAVVSVNTTLNTVTLTAHTLLTGDGPFRFETTGAWAGITGVDWWIIKVDADTVKLAASFQDAINLAAFDLVSAGTGTHTLVDKANTFRAGSEITYTSRGQRECIVTLQAYGGTFAQPMTLLHDAIAGANLQTRRDAFKTAGIGMAGFGPVQSLDGVLGESIYEPRAIVECRFFLANEVSENTTFIQFVELEDEVENTSVYVPEDPT